MAIHWYGERGIVNALVTLIDSSPDRIEYTKSLLSCIQWGRSNRVAWVNDIVDVDFIVEIGLFSFGDPDLILVCTTSQQEQHVVFVEAKAISYWESVEQGGPSCIHRQLTLKYRFARSLCNWDRNVTRPIVETTKEHAAYFPSADDAPFIETNRWPRKIAKRSVLEILARVITKPVKASQVYFVAWTWDIEPFWTRPDFLTSVGRPLFLDNEGIEVLDNYLERVGWLGYHAIADCSNLQELKGPFELARSTMQPSNYPVEATENQHPERDVRFSMLTSLQKDDPRLVRYQTLREYAIERFGISQVLERKTSLSVTIVCAGQNRPKVLLKIGPHLDVNKIVVAVSTWFNRKEWAGRSAEGSIGRISESPFFVFELQADESGVQFTQAVCDEVLSLVTLETETDS